MKKTTSQIIAILAITLSISACKKDNTGENNELKKAVVANYATIVHANYNDALAKAEVLKTKIDDFVAAPTQASLDAAKQAWLDARLPYGQTEAYRFYSGPIDDDNGPEGLLNAWPLDEAYIDYVQGNATAGIINDTAAHPVISKQVIENLNEQGGETNVSCGFHAIEFLLWGQDFSASSAGNRPFTDYTTAPNAQRRGAYLQACAALLVEHLDALVAAWAPSSTGNYRASFESQNSDVAIKNIIQGIGFLTKGELAGERLEVAYDSQLQEDEHSCFSDNTHNDVRMNILGIQNVFLGSYQTTAGSTISGSGIYDVLKLKDAAAADELKAKLEDSKTKCYAISAPFDQQIVASNTTGRAAVKAAIDALKLQGDKLAAAAKNAGYDIVIE
ncbi:MAG: hypothetical protein KF872_01250 [Chitinophagales bacterium]|nr:hypothetical protein [Chitinophagales bacterium]